jgi:hypothetical protein
MGRTTPSVNIVLMQEEAAFGRFRRALRRSDQLALDDLFTAAKLHTDAAQFASHALPFETILLSMLLEEHKEVRRLRDQVETLMTRKLANPENGKLTNIQTTRSGLIDPGFGFDDDPKVEQEESNE